MKGLFLFFLIFGIVFSGCSNNESETKLEPPDTQSTAALSIRSNVTEAVPYATNFKIALLISAPINAETVNEETVYILDENNQRIGLSLESGNDGDTGKILLTPYIFFKPSSNYTLIVTTGLQDIYGRTLNEEYHYTFTTSNDPVNTSELLLRATKPKADMIIDAHSDISLEFSSTLSNEASYTGEELIQVTSNGTKIEGRVEFFNSILTFVPDVFLPSDAIIDVSLVGAVKDMYGNIYDGNLTTWSFQTQPPESSLVINKGFTSYLTYPTNEDAHLVRIVHNIDEEDMLMVVRQNTVDFYGVDMSNVVAPTLAKRYSMDFDSPILDVHYAKEHKGIVYFATLRNGFYVTKLDSNTTQTLHHIPYEKSIYGIHAGHTHESYINYSVPDRLYITGPDIGMDIYALKDGIEPVFLQTAIDPNAVYLRAVDVHYESIGETKVYVTNYNHGIHVYDENGSNKIAEPDLNIAVRDVSVMFDQDVQEYRPIIFSLMGNMYELDKDGTFGNKYAEMLWKYQEYSTDGMNSFFFVGGGFLMIFNIDGGYEGIIDSGGWIASADYGLADTSYGQVEFIVTLDEDGTIQFWNRYAQN